MKREPSADSGREKRAIPSAKAVFSAWLVVFVVLVMDLPVSSRASGEDIAVIVAGEWSAAKSIEPKILKRIFLGKTSHFAGQPVHPVNQEEGSPVRELFNSRVLKKSEARLSKYWIQEVLSGGSQPPVQASGFRSVVAIVTSVDGAIGYVDLERMKSEAPRNVKIIAEIN